MDDAGLRLAAALAENARRDLDSTAPCYSFDCRTATGLENHPEGVCARLYLERVRKASLEVDGDASHTAAAVIRFAL